MKIKMFNVSGMGFVIGEQVKQDEETIFLKYPALFLPQQQTPQGNRDIVISAIPPMLANREELLKVFPLKKIQVIYSGKPIPAILQIYSDFYNQLQEKITGIKKVTPADMQNLTRI